MSLCKVVVMVVVVLWDRSWVVLVGLGRHTAPECRIDWKISRGYSSQRLVNKQSWVCEMVEMMQLLVRYGLLTETWVDVYCIVVGTGVVSMKCGLLSRSGA